MTNLSTDICLKFKEARKAKGMNQSALARVLGCQQSAISMFESGQATKLSDETVKKMADFLGIKLEEEKKHQAHVAEEVVPPNVASPVVGVQRGYCPNCQCPSNVPYVVEGRLFFRPSREHAVPTGGARCVCCGEVLEQRCPVCGAPLNEGACCAVCGSTYVTPTVPKEIDPVAYARIRREEIVQLRALA